jgi:hypothetical protein
MFRALERYVIELYREAAFFLATPRAASTEDGEIEAEAIERGLDPIDILIFCENPEHGFTLVSFDLTNHISIRSAATQAEFKVGPGTSCNDSLEVGSSPSGKGQ